VSSVSSPLEIFLLMPFVTCWEKPAASGAFGLGHIRSNIPVTGNHFSFCIFYNVRLTIWLTAL